MSLTTESIRADEQFTPTIPVGRDVLPIALKHGMQLWWDGSTPTKRLDERNESDQFTRYVNARVEGKISEVAFSELLSSYFDVSSAVDWRIYGDYTRTDNGDLEKLIADGGDTFHPATPFDIKKTKPWNQWLCVRENVYSSFEEGAPIILTKFALMDDLDVSDWEETNDWDTVDKDDVFRRRLLSFSDANFPISVEFSGIAYKDEFTEHFDAGDMLYDPDTGADLGNPLKCDNRAIHVDDLVSTPMRWNRAVCDIIGDTPIDFDPLPVIE